MSDGEETATAEVTALTLVDENGASVSIEVHRETADAIFKHGAQATVYPVDIGDNPEASGDSFSSARQRILNAIIELRAAHASHAIMAQAEQPISFARHLAEQQCILTFNMLGQAGLLEARMAARQQEMQETVEKSIIVPGGDDIKVSQ